VTPDPNAPRLALGNVERRALNEQADAAVLEELQALAALSPPLDEGARCGQLSLWTGLRLDVCRAALTRLRKAGLARMAGRFSQARWYAAG